jgi:aspartate-semialdehyde dehydrogenase
MNRNPHVAVVGATGAVGIEMIKTLEKRNFPVGKLTLLASARSAGKKLKFRGADVTVKELIQDSFNGIESWYNQRHRHSALDYQSPVAFEIKFMTN